MAKETPLEKELRFAAVDIGSNAVRLHISRVHLKDGAPVFKRLERLRYPLRLGTDVFTEEKQISNFNQDKFIEVMHVFKGIMDLFNVDGYMACATSAMREAKNGKELVERTREVTGVDIQIISGDKEAEIINKSILQYVDTASFVHIDVGGGSTELNVYHNLKKIHAHSFDMGSVRSLLSQKKENTSPLLKDWITNATKDLSTPISAVGTGGNINKLYDLSKNKDLHLSISQIEDLYKELKKLSYKERVSHLGLNHDRADVIIPATEIYLKVMKAAKIKELFVPKVGLREGIIIHLYEQFANNH